jgi:hypothetical protein
VPTAEALRIRRFSTTLNSVSEWQGIRSTTVVHRNAGLVRRY